ncbi:MAG TPA: hypothetical protein VMT18_13380, partial [Planctomycetota bacterium]|nr:hypothetical protein [Planctomycetota bacterium]
DPAVASPELEDVFGAARKQAGLGTAKDPGAKDPGAKDPGARDPTETDPGKNGGPTGEDVKGLIHSPIDDARPGEALTDTAQVGNDISAHKVYVLYRQSGQADYTPLQMKNNGGHDYVAIIPGDVIGDRPLQYYIEARDKKGRPLVGSGSAPNPYIITLNESAPGARIVRRDEVKKADDRKKFHRLFVFVMPGFGFGYHPGGNTTEVAWQLKSNAQGQVLYQRAAVDAPGGVAIAPFHIGVEVGGMVTRGLSLSLLGRFEVVTGANAQTVRTETGELPMGGTTRAAGAVAGFVRARYRFLNGRLHPYVHVDIGGGEIRHALNLASAQTADKPLVDEATARAYNDDPSATIDRQIVCAATANCYDSMRQGLLFIGGGAGLWYDVHKYIGLILDLNVLGAIGVGNGQAGMNIDVQLGVGAHFL